MLKTSMSPEFTATDFFNEPYGEHRQQSLYVALLQVKSMRIQAPYR